MVAMPRLRHPNRSLAVLPVAAALIVAGCSSSGSKSGSPDSSSPMTMPMSPSMSMPMTTAPATTAPASPKTVAVAVDAKGDPSGIPATLTAGTYTLSATAPAGAAEYSVQLARLSPGYTQAQLFSDVAAGIAAEKPDLAAVTRLYAKTTLVGGPAGSGAQTSTVFLPAGDYVYVNTDVQGQPTPHTFTVTSGDSTPALPATATTITASGDMAGKFTFDVRGSLSAGGAVTFTNNSEDNAHFLAVAKVKPGHTAAQCEAYEGDLSDAKSPCEEVLDTTILSQAASETTTFAAHGPGTYLLACFMPDPKTGKPHAMEGMLKTVTVA